MRKAFVLALTLASCQDTSLLGPEIRIVRSEADHLQQEFPPESPIWLPEFDNLMEDNTPTVPQTIYRHVVRRLCKMPESEIAAQVKTGVRVRDLKDDPARHRGRFVRIVGRVSSVWPEEVNFAGFPRRQIYAGILYVNDREPVLFHFLNPQLLYAKEDMIGLDGLFLKVVAYELSNGGELRAPLLVASSVRKYH
jgi:hypothetical protein